MPALKYFIHECDGYFGKVMGDYVRNHALPEEQPTICGSLIDPRNKPTWADEVVRSDDLLALKKALLTADVIIYDVSTSPKDATSALKVLLPVRADCRGRIAATGGAAGGSAASWS